jgi:hypothetical protein
MSKIRIDLVFICVTKDVIVHEKSHNFSVYGYLKLQNKLLVNLKFHCSRKEHFVFKLQIDENVLL